jgi:hypothetical protein
MGKELGWAPAYSTQEFIVTVLFAYEKGTKEYNRAYNKAKMGIAGDRARRGLCK